MKVLVTSSERFAMTSDGNLWSVKGSLSYSSLWANYLEVYDQVYLLSRAKPVSEPPPGWAKATGPGITAVPVPYFVGPKEYVKKYSSVKRTIAKAVAEAEAFQLRIPCSIGSQVYSLLPANRPVGIEVVADPYDTFAPGSIKHPLRPAFRWWFPRELRHQCARATAALYVTQQALQRRYPCPNYTVGVSDVGLSPEMLVSESRQYNSDVRPFTLVQVGTMEQLYKAPNITISAVAACVQAGLDIKLVMLGDGKYRPQLEEQARNLGISERVQFCGNLPNRLEVCKKLDQADLFVLPSYQEGLPKAMVEAMARALPCIGSTVGGFPELLPEEDMVPPGNVDALAQKIRSVITNPQRMTNMSARNLEIAQNYTEEILHKQRLAFYRYVREQTELYLAS
jgi:glycosyltransferase involved in cell wall biosynthesis